MKKVIQSSFVLLTILMSNIVMSSTLSNNTLNKLMDLSGINKQISEYPAMVSAGVNQARQQGGAIPDAEFAKINKVIEHAFKPADIIAEIGREIKKNLSESEAKELMSWYKSALGKRITRAEEQAGTPEGYAEMMKQANSLLADKPRVKLAQQLESLVQSTEMTMQLQEKSGVAVYTAISSAMNPGVAVNIKPFKDQMEKQKPQMKASMEQLVIVSFVYSYRNIDIPSIKKYINFNKKSATRKLNQSGMKGIANGLDRSIDIMAKSLAETYKKQAKK